VLTSRTCFSTQPAGREAGGTNSRAVAYWLFGLSGLVAGMVSIGEYRAFHHSPKYLTLHIHFVDLGGITRLTRSGLSMTDWKLTGSLPPMTTEQWEREFERYKTFPEWQQRQSMTINEFKYIYFWEYG
jgi:hypothetical protein